MITTKNEEHCKNIMTFYFLPNFFFKLMLFLCRKKWCYSHNIYFHKKFIKFFSKQVVNSSHLDLWVQRICDPGPLYIRVQGLRRGETLLRTCSENPNGLEMQSRTIISSASQNLEGKNNMPSKAAPKALPEEKTSTVGLA